MSYDDYINREPDEPWNRGVPCATKGCSGIVTFPDFESFCTNCYVRFEERKQQLEEQASLLEVKVRRG